GFSMAKVISDKLNSKAWYSTQSIGFALHALGTYYAANKPPEQMKFSYRTPQGRFIEVVSTSPVIRIPLKGSDMSQTIEIQSQIAGPLFVRVLTKGQPAVGAGKANASKLAITSKFYDSKGKEIDLNAVRQGSDITAYVTVSNNSNTNATNIALSQIFPAGMEIRNERLGGDDSAPSGVDYQDIRDDRVNTFFDLAASQTKSIRVSLQATYAGTYHMPAVLAEAMYDDTFRANSLGRVVKIVR
ncbi:MAG: hypothetical protein ABIV51_08505, partial [Saprospiraceae bacterium]